MASENYGRSSQVALFFPVVRVKAERYGFAPAFPAEDMLMRIGGAFVPQGPAEPQHGVRRLLRMHRDQARHGLFVIAHAYPAPSPPGFAPVLCGLNLRQGGWCVKGNAV